MARHIFPFRIYNDQCTSNFDDGQNFPSCARALIVLFSLLLKGQANADPSNRDCKILDEADIVDITGRMT